MAKGKNRIQMDSTQKFSNDLKGFSASVDKFVEATQAHNRGRHNVNKKLVKSSRKQKGAKTDEEAIAIAKKREKMIDQEIKRRQQENKSFLKNRKNQQKWDKIQEASKIKKKKADNAEYNSTVKRAKTGQKQFLDRVRQMNVEANKNHKIESVRQRALSKVAKFEKKQAKARRKRATAMAKNYYSYSAGSRVGNFIGNKVADFGNMITGNNNFQRGNFASNKAEKRSKSRTARRMKSRFKVSPIRLLGNAMLLSGAFMMMQVAVRGVINQFTKLSEAMTLTKSNRVGLNYYSGEQRASVKKVASDIQLLTGSTKNQSTQQALQYVSMIREAGYDRKFDSIMEVAQVQSAISGTDLKQTLTSLLRRSKDEGGWDFFGGLQKDFRARGLTSDMYHMNSSSMINRMINAPMAMFEEMASNMEDSGMYSTFKNMTLAVEGFFNPKIWQPIMESFTKWVGSIKPEDVIKFSESLKTGIQNIGIAFQGLASFVKWIGDIPQKLESFADSFSKGLGNLLKGIILAPLKLLEVAYNAVKNIPLVGDAIQGGEDFIKNSKIAYQEVDAMTYKTNNTGYGVTKITVQAGQDVEIDNSTGEVNITN